MRNEIQDILLNIVLFSGAVSVGYKQPKRKLFLARFIGSFLFMCLFRYFVFREIYPMPEDGMFLASSCFGFLMLLVILCLTMWFSFECDFWGALFCGIAGYCIQHVIERGYSIIRILFMQGASGFACGTVFVLLSAAVIASVYFLFRGSIRGRITVNNKLLLGIAAVVVFATILLDVLSIATWIPAGSDATACGFAFSLMVGLVTFFMQMGLLSTKKIEEERDLIRQVMEESKEQYYFEKSIIDTVNVKVHDIKHQIAAS